jgi:hypothetical protein
MASKKPQKKGGPPAAPGSIPPSSVIRKSEAMILCEVPFRSGGGSLHAPCLTRAYASMRWRPCPIRTVAYLKYKNQRFEALGFTTFAAENSTLRQVYGFQSLELSCIQDTSEIAP